MPTNQKWRNVQGGCFEEAYPRVHQLYRNRLRAQALNYFVPSRRMCTPTTLPQHHASPYREDPVYGRQPSKQHQYDRYNKSGHRQDPYHPNECRRKERGDGRHHKEKQRHNDAWRTRHEEYQYVKRADRPAFQKWWISEGRYQNHQNHQEPPTYKTLHRRPPCLETDTESSPPLRRYDRLLRRSRRPVVDVRTETESPLRLPDKRRHQQNRKCIIESTDQDEKDDMSWFKPPHKSAWAEHRYSVPSSSSCDVPIGPKPKSHKPKKSPCAPSVPHTQTRVPSWSLSSSDDTLRPSRQQPRARRPVVPSETDSVFSVAYGPGPSPYARQFRQAKNGVLKETESVLSECLSHSSVGSALSCTPTLYEPPCDNKLTILGYVNVPSAEPPIKAGAPGLKKFGELVSNGRDISCGSSMDLRRCLKGNFYTDSPIYQWFQSGEFGYLTIYVNRGSKCLSSFTFRGRICKYRQSQLGMLGECLVQYEAFTIQQEELVVPCVVSVRVDEDVGCQTDFVFHLRGGRGWRHAKLTVWVVDSFGKTCAPLFLRGDKTYSVGEVEAYCGTTSKDFMPGIYTLYVALDQVERKTVKHKFSII